MIRKCPPHATDQILSIANAGSQAPTPTEAELTHALRPWQAVLDAATPDGIPLTKAGWMAPAACEKIWHESGLAWPYGKGNREQNTPELSKIRQVCTQGKLIRKHKDALVLTPLGRKAASDQTVLAKAAAASLVMCPDDFDSDVCALTMLALAAGFTEEGSEPLTRLHPLGDEIARLMSTLGWRVGTGLVERGDLGRAYYQLIDMMQAGSEGEGRNYGLPQGGGVRHLARLAVLAS
ncbi:hypothetical protein [Yimella sp. cx-51]|uniref:hypothetical protein n=1 Tax=Yimella sp. cx-51 TaxID=2770551 RepID=UPI00165EAE41|nr:hypothetical protein [Yimella sp. cx-51]MBC9958382.1 hypothetical protein [Yimella sp. cx-51]QTH38213.1 hypothetical protein J5M86_00505 [Yimella sp. cx-51]